LKRTFYFFPEETDSRVIVSGAEENAMERNLLKSEAIDFDLKKYRFSPYHPGNTVLETPFLGMNMKVCGVKIYSFCQ